MATKHEHIIIRSDGRQEIVPLTDEEIAARQERARIHEEAAQQREAEKQRRQERLEQLETVRDEVTAMSLDPGEMTDAAETVRRLVKLIKLLQLEIADRREPDIPDFI